MAKSSTRVALIQMSCEASTQANLAKAVARVREAAESGARLICLPELFRAQYFCQREDHALFDIAEAIPGPSTKALSEVVREHKLVVIASLFERRAPGLYHNTAAVLDHVGDATKDNVVALYRKMHIPDDPLYHEKFYFTPGDLGFQAWDTKPGKIGVCICWDQWYPEAARLTALRGAEIIFYPTAIGWHPSEKKEFGAAQHNAWETIQRSHAIANGCYIAAANRVGHEAPAGGDGIEFWGQSFICGPDGEIIAKGSVDKEEIVIAEIDWARVNEHRTHWPFLRDRRVDAYAGIEQRLLD
jgi:N-carbamoylputrescine amidase